jgi:hypothetical protein
MTGFIAVHNGAIYGAGASPRAALRDAREWVETFSGLTTEPATTALVRFVRRCGFVDSRVDWSGPVARLRRANGGAR